MALDDRFQPLFAEMVRLRTVEQSEKGLRQGGGGGTSGGVSDEWKASVEQRLTELHADVRQMLWAGIVAVAVLVGLIGGLYLRTDAKFAAADDRSNAKFEAIERRLGAIEVDQARANSKLDLLIERTAPAPRAK